MTTSASAAHDIAARYATALLQTADQAQVLDAIEKDMSEAAAMLAASDDLRALIANPLYSRADQKAAVLGLAQKAGWHALSANFLGVLAQNRRLGALGAILSEFRAQLSRRRGEVRAQVVSAFPLTPGQQKMLRHTLATGLSADIRLDLEVDRALLGGLIVTIGSRRIDDSVRGKLERLKAQMERPEANQNAILKKAI